MAAPLPVPSPAVVERLAPLLAPWWLLTLPVFHGLEHVPRSGAVMLVANHTTLGVLDTPLLGWEIYRRRGRLVRGLGDHFHFLIPGWRDLLRLIGVVEGTAENCAGPLRAGEAVLVFPGGAREVFKRRGQKYRLLWGSRLGFARLAIAQGCPIVPVAAVGAEECYDIVLDATHPALSWMRPIGRRLTGRSEVPPLVRGLGPTLVPRPQRFYFALGPPIERAAHRGRAHERGVCVAVRDAVQRAIEAQITGLLAERARDPRRRLLPRLSGALRDIARGGI